MSALEKVLRNLEEDDAVLAADEYVQAAMEVDHIVTVYDEYDDIREEYAILKERDTIKRIPVVDFSMEILDRAYYIKKRGDNLSLNTDMLILRFSDCRFLVRFPNKIAENLKSSLFGLKEPEPKCADWNLLSPKMIEAHSRLLREYRSLVEKLFELTDGEMLKRLDYTRQPLDDENLPPEEQERKYRERREELEKWAKRNYYPYLYKAHFILTSKYGILASYAARRWGY